MSDLGDTLRTSPTTLPDVIQRRSGVRATISARAVLAAVGAAVLSVVLAGCSVDSGWQLEQAIIEAGEGGFTLSAVDAIDADAYLVICPYESKDSVQQRLGVEWPAAPDYSDVDDKQTIAFVSDGEVASHVELSRDDVDFCVTGDWPELPVGAELELAASPGGVKVRMGM